MESLLVGLEFIQLDNVPRIHPSGVIYTVEPYMLCMVYVLPGFGRRRRGRLTYIQSIAALLHEIGPLLERSTSEGRWKLCFILISFSSHRP